MREQLNSNPVVQLGVVAVLLVAGVFFFMSMSGGGKGGGSSEAGEAAPSAETTLGTAGAEAEGGAAVPVEAVPPPPVKPPARVIGAWDSGATVALLFVRDGGIDDRLVRETTESLSGFPGVVTFVVPVREVARYSAITGGVGVDQVPALVVMTPKKLSHGTPTASVHFGFQSRQAIAQALIDAGYEGPTLDYHP